MTRPGQFEYSLLAKGGFFSWTVQQQLAESLEAQILVLLGHWLIAWSVWVSFHSSNSLRWEVGKIPWWVKSWEALEVPGFGSWGKCGTMDSFHPVPQSPVTEAFDKKSLEIKALALRRPVSAKKSLSDLGLFPASQCPQMSNQRVSRLLGQPFSCFWSCSPFTLLANYQGPQKSSWFLDILCLLKCTVSGI